MDRFIGLDAHPSSCTFGVINEGDKTIRTEVVETNGQSLVEFVCPVPDKTGDGDKNVVKSFGRADRKTHPGHLRAGRAGLPLFTSGDQDTVFYRPRPIRRVWRGVLELFDRWERPSP